MMRSILTFVRWVLWLSLHPDTGRAAPESYFVFPSEERLWARAESATGALQPRTGDLKSFVECKKRCLTRRQKEVSVICSIGLVRCFPASTSVRGPRGYGCIGIGLGR
ncbi:hypothetical protein BC834DRAFT_392496 [Gloeopeniophorella convolvens]|nr:hypothetical protein BC834DRAFT_392496 [Gloeopeniophorella convolvens]